MHHPGPPLFRSVGEAVELAPRDPDPDAAYAWRLVDAPDASAVALDGDANAVRHVTPDEPGVYRFELRAPDGVHVQTVRVFPDERRPARFEARVADFPLPPADVERVSAVGAFNEFRLGRDRPRREGDRYVLDARLPPGDHACGFAPNDDRSKQVDASVSVPGPGRPRLRLDATVERDGREPTVVVTADARRPPDGERDPEVTFAFDDRDPVSMADATATRDELRLPLAALPADAPVRVHAVAAAERRSVPDRIALRRPGAPDAASASDAAEALSVARSSDPPAWATDAVVYQIFVRAFAGPAVSTTFREIERRAAYLDSLGVDCVWLTPVLASPTRHGYHVTDYFRVADDLGARARFESLVAALRDRGIRVVFDLVANHTSRDHPAFQLHAAGVEEYADYYPRQPEAADTTGVDWAGEGAPVLYFEWERIPNLNYDSLAVRRWMLDVVDEWAEVVDGFRCDIAWGVPHGFWTEVRDRTPPGFLLLDETLPRDARAHDAAFGVHYDSHLYETLRAVGRGDAPADRVLSTFADARRAGFPDGAAFLRYVENHDETRYLADCGEAALRAAAAATFTLPGLPTVYYGQERGMTQRRGPMRWHDGDAALTDYHRRLSRTRERLSALRDPSPPDPVAYDARSDGVVAYARGGGRGRGDERDDARAERDPDRVVVVLNFDATPRTVGVDEAADARDLLAETDVSADADAADSADGVDGSTAVRVRDAVVLRARAADAS